MRKSASDEQKQEKSSQIRILTASKAKELLDAAYKDAKVQLKSKFSDTSMGWKKKPLKKLDNLIKNLEKSDDAMWQLMQFILDHKNNKDFRTEEATDKTVDFIIDELYKKLDKDYIPFSLYETVNQFDCLEHLDLKLVLSLNYQKELSEILSTLTTHKAINPINSDEMAAILKSNIGTDKLTCKYTAEILKKLSENGLLNQENLDILIAAGKSEGSDLLLHWLTAIKILEITDKFNPTNLHNLLQKDTQENITQFVEKFQEEPFIIKEEKRTNPEIINDNKIQERMKNKNVIELKADRNKELKSSRDNNSIVDYKKGKEEKHINPVRKQEQKKSTKETASFDNKSDYNAICAFFRKPKTKLPSSPTPVKNPTREFGFR